jgi:phage baseplate assembly protein W
MAQGLAVALPLRVDTSDGAYGLHKDLESMAAQNLKMVILTSPGERVMIPEFGVGIRNFIFEPNNPGTKEAIRERIQNQISKYLPYISLLSLELFSPSVANGTDNTVLVIKIKYSVPAANIVSELTLDTNTGAMTTGNASGGAGGSGGGY